MRVFALVCAPLLACAATEIELPASQVSDSSSPDPVGPGAEAPSAPVVPPGQALFTDTLHQISITVAEADVAKLSPENETPVPATVTYDGVTVTQVGLTLKRGGGSRRDINGKAGFSVKFNDFIDGQALDGLTKLTFGNSVQDPSFVSEALTYDLFRRAGLLAPRTALARVTFNGTSFGLYVVREAYNKRFLKSNFTDATGNLYEGRYHVDVTDVTAMDLRTNETVNDRSDLQALAQALQSADAELPTALAAVVDLDQFYRFWAVELLTHHWDGYGVGGCCAPNNYYVYRDPSRGRFVFLPHGADQTLESVNQSVLATVPDIARLARRLQQLPTFGTRIRSEIAAVLAAWKTDELVARAQALGALVRQEGLQGEREEHSLQEFEGALGQRIQFLQQRPAAVQGQLD
jgi:hypothetical protein